MAKMFGILRSPFAASPGRTAKQATRTGDEQLTAELNNQGRGSDAGGKTTVITTLFSDGSGILTLRRAGEALPLRYVWSADEQALGLRSEHLKEVS